MASRLTRTTAGLWILCWLLCPLANALDPHRALDHYGQQVWQTGSGLPQNTVRSVLQTRDGFVWLATDGGLERFDGIDFVTYDVENTPQFQSDTIYDLLEDADGALWISTAAGLIRYRDGSFSAFTTDQGLPAATVWFTYQDHHQRLWAMTAGGPAWWNGKAFTPVAGASSAIALNRQSLAEDDNGRLWLGSSSGLFALDSSTTPRAQLISGARVEAVLLDPLQTLWVASNEGLARWRGGKLTSLPLPHPSGKPEVTALLAKDGGVWAGTAAGVVSLTADGTPHALAGNAAKADRIDGFFRDREGTVWISTERGLFRQRGEQVEAFAPGSGLATNRVLAVHEDREGDLWVGTDGGGLTLLRDQTFTTYTTRDGLSGNYVRAVLQAADGTLWLGTDGAGLNRRTAGGFLHYTTADGLCSNVILSLASGAGGDLWIGTPDGLNLLHPVGNQGIRVKRFTSANGLPDDFIRSLYTDADGSLWIGTRHGLAHLVNQAFTSFSMLDGLGSDFIGAIFRQGVGGDLWIGTSGGLTRLRAGAFANFPIPPGLANNTVTAIAQGEGGTLLLGTNGGGLYRFSHSIEPAFPAWTHTLPGTIYAILEDGSKRLWLSAPTGIYRVALPQSIAGGAPAVTAYGTGDGMNIRECSGGSHPTACKLLDGSLWFATLDGVSVIDPAHAAGDTVAPPVVIERVLVDDQLRAFEQKRQQELTLKPGANRLEFQYAGLSFAAPQKVQYRYRLEGFDHDWIEAGTRRAAFYTNLPPGHYRFQVLAANHDGAWNSTGASFALRLLPHYYQTYWFYTLLALATAVLGYLAYRWRVRQVEAQFSAVLAERGRLAREIHDTLAQGFVGVSVQLEVVTRLLSAGRETQPALQPVLDQLAQARAVVRESLAEARSSIWNLRSESASGGEDLPARLSRGCQHLAGSSSVKVYLQVKGTYRPVLRKTEDELLRIGQEAVTNAVRHAGATRIDVLLIYESARIFLEVADDGRGFAPLPGDSGPEGHYGIRGMYERAQQIGSVLQVKSAPGAGTRISVEAPLAERLP